MDFVNQVMNWVQQNWGVTVFGGLSIGGIISMVLLMAKQWISNKTQGTKYEQFYESSKEQINNIRELYEMEKAKNAEKDMVVAFQQEAQAFTMDAIIKLILSSKLDSDDKVAVVAGAERLKQMAPKEIVQSVKDKAETVVTNLTKEANENPEQTIFNIANSATTLLDKYNKQKEE